MGAGLKDMVLPCLCFTEEEVKMSSKAEEDDTSAYFAAIVTLNVSAVGTNTIFVLMLSLVSMLVVVLMLVLVSLLVRDRKMPLLG